MRLLSKIPPHLYHGYNREWVTYFKLRQFSLQPFNPFPFGLDLFESWVNYAFVSVSNHERSDFLWLVDIQLVASDIQPCGWGSLLWHLSWWPVRKLSPYWINCLVETASHHLWQSVYGLFQQQQFSPIWRNNRHAVGAQIPALCRKSLKHQKKKLYMQNLCNMQTWTQTIIHIFGCHYLSILSGKYIYSFWCFS